MSFPDSSVVYEGNWVHGKRHGQGKITFNAEGTHWYQGTCCLMHMGRPMLCMQGGACRCERCACCACCASAGSWLDDQKSGEGKMQYANGDVYEGSWEHDLKCA